MLLTFTLFFKLEVKKGTTKHDAVENEKKMFANKQSYFYLKKISLKRYYVIIKQSSIKNKVKNIKICIWITEYHGIYGV